MRMFKETIYHIKRDPTNRIATTFCGRNFRTQDIETAVIKDGQITNGFREIEAEEICQKCFKGFKRI